MIKIHFLRKIAITLVATMMVGLCSCDKDDDFLAVDFYPVEVVFYIIDQQGNNLIAEGAPLYGADFSLTYEGELYDARWEQDDVMPLARTYMAIMHGLCYKEMKINGRNTPCLVFGEIDGGTNLNTTMTLTRPDGIKDIVGIKRSVTNDLKIKQSATLNGVDISWSNGPTLYVTIVSNPNSIPDND